MKKTQVYQPKDNCDIQGIGQGTIISHGSTYTDILVEGQRIFQEFHIVPHDFPIPFDGILGRDFYTSYQCRIDYYL